MRFKGTVVQGMDYVWNNHGNNGIWGGAGTPNWAVMAQNKINCVRIQMTTASWLGYTVYDPNSDGSAWSTSYNSDPSGNYRQSLIDAVAQIQNAGIPYVIIDFQGCSPDLTIGGVTHHVSPANYSQAPDVSCLACMTNILQTFGSNVTPPTSSYGPINNGNVIIDPFNEPNLNIPTNGGNNVVMSGAGGTGSTLTNDQAILNGGYCKYLRGANGDFVAWWKVVGYQALCNAARATGAQNLIAWNASASFAASIGTPANYMPNDSANNSCIQIHTYGYGTGDGGKPAYPETGQYIYVGTYPDSTSGSSHAFDPAAAVVASQYPVFVGEYGGYDGTSYTSGEPQVSTTIGLIKAAGLSGALYFAGNPTNNQSTGDLQMLMSISGSVVPSPGGGKVHCNSDLALP